MTLPFDVSRCEDCRRREPGHPERQSYISPPKIIAFECAYRIHPEVNE